MTPPSVVHDVPVTDPVCFVDLLQLALTPTGCHVPYSVGPSMIAEASGANLTRDPRSNRRREKMKFLITVVITLPYRVVGFSAVPSPLTRTPRSQNFEGVASLEESRQWVGESSNRKTTDVALFSPPVKKKNDVSSASFSASISPPSSMVRLQQENEDLRFEVERIREENERLRQQQDMVLERFEHGDDNMMTDLEDSACPIEPTLSFVDAIKDRSAWLVGLLVLQSCSGFILSRNEDLLAHHPTIIYFLTMLVGAGGNAGNQASVRVIRGLATGALKESTESRFLWRELKMAIFLSAILSAAGFTRAILFHTPIPETIAVTTSLTLIVSSSIGLGALLPLALKRIGVDPAHSSTTIQVREERSHAHVAVSAPPPSCRLSWTYSG
eukprot:CAMPEP_0116842526 /NCGR_PEP_ID=MMETSP0418-20121206/11569_1 /TAXON_ID=1158023 /ORGANISM="Astrosyne radiata, Strain 13vi08-1A" /LENGTH=384 /DNA_ID=CAMNT_0004473153 /DNA_START=163 /DNA_END=1318 /DNA_ORIENTATION=-